MKKSPLPRHPIRFPVDVPARFRLEGGGPWVEGRLVNLSKGGLCLTTNAAPEEGTRLEIVTVSTDKGGRSHARLLRAKVIWRKPGRCGVQFVQQTRASKPKPATSAPSRSKASVEAKAEAKAGAKSGAGKKKAPVVGSKVSASRPGLRMVPPKKKS